MFSDARDKIKTERRMKMSKELTRDEAWELLNEIISDSFHLKHAVTVEGVMSYFARELGYVDDAEFWGIVGL